MQAEDDAFKDNVLPFNNVFEELVVVDAEVQVNCHFFGSEVPMNATGVIGTGLQEVDTIDKQPETSVQLAEG